MGFVGSLGDLSLDNILQVVSLSSQTGLLSLRDGEAGGEIAFRHGKVVGGWIELPDENAGNWLVRRGVVDQGRLDQALDLLDAGASSETVADILQKRFGIDRTAINRAGRREIEKVLSDLLCWEKGTFSFETCRQEDLPNRFRSRCGVLIDEGILPLFSLNTDNEPAVISAETPEPESAAASGHFATATNGAAVESVAESDSLTGESPWSLTEAVSEGTGEVFLVDDDPQVREKLARDLSAQGWEVTQFARGSDLLVDLDRSVDKGNRPTVLIDLIMPRFNGEGILGGLELLQVVRSRYPDLPILMFSDYFCTETEKRIQELGVAQLVVKPHRRTLEGEGGGALDGFVQRIAKALPASCGPKVAEVPGNEGNDDARSSCPMIAQDEGGDPSRRQLALLKTLSTELCVHDLEEQARLLVLRFAAELFDRAVIFSINGDRMQGSGQFGFENFSGVQGNRLGEVVISLREPSIFSSVLENRIPVKRRLGGGDWERCFARSLDGPAAAEIFLGPVLCQGRVVSILYGDTLPGGQPFGETAGLEVFLNQVGLLKERAMLKAALGSPAPLF